MPCAQCGAENPAGTKFCANCGAPQAQAAAPVQQQPGAQGGGWTTPAGPQQSRPQSSVSIDFRRLGTGDIIAVSGCILLFISLFLSWYSVSGEDISFSTSAIGSYSGGWRVLILILDILIILYLFIRTMTPRGIRLPLPHWQFLTVLLGLQFLLTLLAFLIKPSTGDHWSWSYGAFIGLVAAVIAVIGGIVRRNEPEVMVPGVPRTGFSSFRTTPQPPAMGTTPGGGAQGTSCAQCGSSVPPGTPYCTTCGAPISG